VDLAWNQETARRNSLQGKTIAITGWSPLYLELGRTYRSLGESQNALEAFARGRWIDPRAEFFEEMAATYRATGNPEQAAITLLEGVTMDVSGQVRLAAEVMDLYRQTAPQSCALTGSGSSAALNFACPLVHGQLCAAGRNAAILYRQRQQENEAAAIAASAVGSLGCPVEMFR
jgi:tetratricopeptide (TPR) repeat protein